MVIKLLFVFAFLYFLQEEMKKAKFEATSKVNELMEVKELVESVHMIA